MIISKCKNCQNDSHIVPIEDFKWKFDSDDPVELINGFKCNVCDAIYSIVDEELDFWYFEKYIGVEDKFKAAENYTTDEMVALMK